VALMDICPCNGLSETDIKDAIAAGAGTLEAVFEFHDMVTYCGCCLIDIDGFLFPSDG
jgi:bacterioferritin-associated ferredoxin